MISWFVVIGCIYSYVFSEWAITIDEGTMLLVAVVMELGAEIVLIKIIQHLRGK